MAKQKFFHNNNVMELEIVEGSVWSTPCSWYRLKDLLKTDIVVGGLVYSHYPCSCGQDPEGCWSSGCGKYEEGLFVVPRT